MSPFVAASNASAGGSILAIVLGIIAFCLYFLPSILAMTRKVVNVGSVVAINLLLGWTLIGWAVALAMALRTNPPHAYPQYWQQSPPPQSPPPPGFYLDATGQQRYWNGQRWTDHTR